MTELLDNEVDLLVYLWVSSSICMYRNFLFRKMKNAEWKRKLSEDINRGLTKFNLGRGGFGEISGCQ